MIDRFPRMRSVAIATGIFTGAVALTGCSEYGNMETPKPSVSKDPLADVQAPAYQKIERKISDGFVDTYLLEKPDTYGDTSLMYAYTSYCDKKDLIDFSYSYIAGSRTFARTPDAENTVCDDGKLTAEDFAN